MAGFMNFLDNDCILIESDDDIEYIHGNQQDTALKYDDDILIESDDDIENIHGNQQDTALKYDDDILIESDDNIENIHGNEQDTSPKYDDDVEIVFDSRSNKVLNNNNDHNHKKRPHSSSNESNNAKRMAVIDLTDDNDEFNKHIKFKRKILKDYPGLCVDMINGLHFYKRLQENEKIEKLKNLEEKVEELNSLSIGELEDWLLEKNLIFQSHYCDKHRNPDGSKVKMILLQINVSEEGSIFKWNKPCCTGDEAIRNLYFRGFLDGQPSPRSMLRLLHHWVTLSKPLSIAKYNHNVPLSFINKFYNELRAVCTAAIHEKIEKFGGKREVVQVCLMYVGPKDSLNTKRLKVVIVGAFDVATKKKVILALPPITQKGTCTSLAILTRFIDRQSVIVIDKSVSKSLFTDVGFQYVYYPFIDGGIPVNNSEAVQSTRTSLHIFDGSLLFLSIEQIQLCLNELIWRENWGTHSLEAYNNFLTHVSELTRIIENFKSQSTVHSVLQAIVANPYEHWKYSTLESCFTNEPITSPMTANHQVHVPESISIQTESIEDVSSVSILEPFYYGTYPGDGVNLIEDGYSISCHLCMQQFSKNDLFIEHLVKHSLNKTGYNKIEVCTGCLKSFSNKLKLANHITNYHKNKPSETSCLICDEDFSYRLRLLEHMKNTHTELELPYRCGLCNFMCSEQKKLSEHFSSFHNKNKKIWCPVCFKIFNVVETKHDRCSYADLNHFTQHILRHLQKPFVEKCTKCSIHFIHAIAMKEHLQNNHSSCLNNVGVVRYEGVMTQRDSRIVRDRIQNSVSARHNSRVLKTIINMYTATPTERTSVDGIPPTFKCIDCEGAFMYHKYNTTFDCRKCAYSTFCEQAIRYHIMDVHIKDYYKHSVLKYNDNSLSCHCGYLSKHSNKMAKHFSSCKIKLLESCDENVINDYIVNSVISKKTVSIFQVKSTPSVLLSLGLITR